MPASSEARVRNVLIMELLQFYYRRFAIHVRKTGSFRGQLTSLLIGLPKTISGVQSTFGSTGSMVFSCFGNGVHPRCIDNGRVEGDNRSAAIV